MNNKETILSFPGIEDTPEKFVEKIMGDRSIDGTATYISGDNLVNLCTADLYVFMANANDFTENKLSMTYSRDQFLNTAKRLYRENGEPEKAEALDVKKKKPLFRGKAKYTS